MELTTKFAKHPDALNRYFTYFLALVMMVSTLSAISVFTDPTPAKAAVAPLSCAQGGECQVGDIGPGGGIVIYIGSSIINQAPGISTGGKYLEAAPSGFESATYNWCDDSRNGNTTLIGANNSSLGGGASNTAIMLEKCASGAGNVAANYSKNGYSDWFLPSTAELGHLNSQKVAISLPSDGIYWGSDETSTIIAAALVISGQAVGDLNKTHLTTLWPIRAFSPGDPLPAPQVVITRASFGSERRTAFITQPQITIQDASSNTITLSSAVITATISAGGTLVGATTATASSGVATFTNLGIDGTVGTTYTITYSSPDLTSTTASITLTGTACDGATFDCQVGDIGPGGGKIFYVAPTLFTQLGATGIMCSTRCKYLEAAPNTWSGGAGDPPTSWSTGANQSLSVTGAWETAIGSGYQNSLAIVAQSGNVAATSAAVAARAYTGGGKGDWYLPSRDELDPLFAQRAIIGGFSGNPNYWSSTEFDGSRASYLFFRDVGQSIRSRADKNDATLYVRPIRAFGPPATVISIPSISGVTAPVRGATPVTSVTETDGYSGTVSWSRSPTTFAPSTMYTATITLTASSGFTLTGVTANFFTVVGATSVTHAANSGVITAVFPSTAAPAAEPVPFLIPLTAPKLRLSAGKLICTPGTYNAGYTLAGVVQGSSTTLFTPSSFTYNLLINGVVQSSLAITTNNSSHSWNMPTATSGSVVTCSTTVSAIGVTNTNSSSENISGVSAALSTQTTAITNANKDYSVALNVNSKAYQKALVDNRATWRSDVEANRSAYLAELNRIGTLTASKTTRTLRSAALKKYMTSQKKISADYAASKSAALAARDAANKTALASRDAATAKANAAYGAFIESIGYGVPIP